jgi:hypothetical protein
MTRERELSIDTLSVLFIAGAAVLIVFALTGEMSSCYEAKWKAHEACVALGHTPECCSGTMMIDSCTHSAHPKEGSGG